MSDFDLTTSMDDLTDNLKPPRWTDELADLIARKRAENELLKKLRATAGPAENKTNYVYEADTESETDK